MDTKKQDVDQTGRRDFLKLSALGQRQQGRSWQQARQQLKTRSLFLGQDTGKQTM